jgi:hypothetical protein
MGARSRRFGSKKSPERDRIASSRTPGTFRAGSGGGLQTRFWGGRGIGTQVTYRPRAGTFIDLYYLFLDNTNRTRQLGLTRGPVTVHTVGTRWAGDVGGAWLYDVEAAGQCADRGAQTVRAGMATAGLGVTTSPT